MKKQKNTFILFLIAIVAVVVGFYFFFNPTGSIFFPKCIFLQLTGYQCPGCGSQRTIHALLHFNIREALTYNALLVVAIPYLLLCCYSRYIVGKEKQPRLHQFLFGKKTIYILLIVVILFGIGRNLF